MQLVVNIHHKVPYDVYIGRGSIWGNPYSHMSNTTAKYRVSTREEAVTKYIHYITNNKELLMSLRHLKDKVLGCYCYPNLCHGMVLVEMSQNYEKWEEHAKTLRG